MSRRCAVLGSPVAHSRSPAIWAAAFGELGLDWSYERVECAEDGLAAVLTQVRADPTWAALSLTMPLKSVALALVDERDEAVVQAAAANTVLRLADGRLRAANTDVDGLVVCLREAAGADRDVAVVLGAGGTARAALVAMGRLGWDSAQVVARDAARAQPAVAAGLAAGVRVDVLPWEQAAEAVARAAVVVATTPAGATDSLAGTSWPATAGLVEVLYSPWPTPLAAAAARAGAPVVGGLRLLAEQAAVAVRLATGRSVDSALLLAAAQAH